MNFRISYEMPSTKLSAAPRSWLGERVRTLHGQAIIADPTRDHACGNPRGDETPQKSRDRAIAIIEKNTALDGRNLAGQDGRPLRQRTPALFMSFRSLLCLCYKDIYLYYKYTGTNNLDGVGRDMASTLIGEYIKRCTQFPVRIKTPWEKV